MWRNLFDAALELIYPPRRLCPLCCGHSPRAMVCSTCREWLKGYAGGVICPRCGSFGSAQASLCFDCHAGGRPFDLARSVGPYEGPLREAVHRLKYRGMKGLARPLGMLMAETAAREPAFYRTQALVPVPLHPVRERQRGFNQALLLARELEVTLRAPVLERAVAKIRATRPQAGLPRMERLHNLGHSFAVIHPGSVAGKIITLVDDVFTTGSTVTNISQILRQAGAAGILVITLAGTRQTGKK